MFGCFQHLGCFQFITHRSSVSLNTSFSLFAAFEGVMVFPRSLPFGALGRIMDFIQGRFLLWAFFGVSVLFVLLFTALLLDDRDFRLAFGLPVVFLWPHCRFATADPPVDL